MSRARPIEMSCFYQSSGWLKMSLGQFTVDINAHQMHMYIYTVLYTQMVHINFI